MSRSRENKIDSFTIDSTQAKQAISTCFDKKRPVFLWGPPGIGKSDVVRQIAEEKGGYIIDIRLSQMEPTDLRGLPVIDEHEITITDTKGKAVTDEDGTPIKTTKKVVEWCQQSFLPNSHNTKDVPIVVLFLDEMNSAAPTVMAAAYQLILDRRIGDYILPENVVVIAAGNRETDRGVTYRMPTPLSNRFVHLEMKVEFDAWFDWAVKNNVHPDVVGYLTNSKGDLFEFDAKNASRAFPTPRTWVFVSEFLSDTDKNDLSIMQSLIGGCVGDGLGVKFLNYRNVASKMPNPMDVLTGKVKHLDLVDDISAHYSLIISLCYELQDVLKKKKNGPDKEFYGMCDNFFRFMMDNKLGEEMIIVGARIAILNYELPLSVHHMKSFKEFHAKYGAYINYRKNKR